MKLYLPDYLLSTLSTKLDKISKNAASIKTRMHTDIVSVEQGQFIIDEHSTVLKLEPPFESNIEDVSNYLGKRWLFDATAPYNYITPVNQLPVKYISMSVKTSEYILPKTEHITLVVRTMGLNSYPIDFYFLYKSKSGVKERAFKSIVTDNNLKNEINRFLSYLY